MKFRISKKPGFRKRVSAILGIACCLSMLIGTLAYFTDRVNISTTSVIGTMDLVFDDISASRSGANGILSPNEFAIDGIWGRSLVQEGSIINPGDYFDLSFNISNEGNKSMDLRQRITLTSTVPMTGNEYVLSIDGLDDESLVGVLSDDGLTLTYELPEVILNGTGTGAEIEDGISASAKDYIVRLDFTGNAGNAFQGSGVTVTLDAQAKQHRNTDDSIWVDWANYKTGIEQMGDQYVPENVPMLAPNSSWFTQGNSGIKRSSITEIEIVDTYTPTGNETATWDASDPSVPGTVTAYVEGTKLTIAGNGYGCVYMNPDSKAAFSDVNGSDNFSSLKNMTGENLLNASKATTFANLFQKASALTSLDIENWDTSNVTDLSRTFQHCVSLESLELGKWDTGNVTTTQLMFGTSSSYGYGAMKLTSIGDTDNWDTSNIKEMQAMFQRCSNLITVNAKNWDVSNVTGMMNMFMLCSSLKSVDVSKWDTGNVTTMQAMFQECSALEELDVSNWDVSSVTNFNYLFNWNGTKYLKIKALDVSKWDTSKATTMESLFAGCKEIEYLDVSNWDVSNVTSFDHTFAHCWSLDEPDFSKWDTSACENFVAMFNNCRSFVSLDVSNFDTSNALKFEQLFDQCVNLEEIIGLENWDTTKVWYFYEMFNNCKKLKVLDLSSFNTSTLTNTEYMFNGCTGLKTIYVGDGWNMSKVEDSTNMFKDTTSIVGGAGTTYNSNATDVTYAKVDGGTADPGYFTYKAAN